LPLACALAATALSAPAESHLVTLAPDGAYTWYNDPRALFHNGRLYFGCVRGDGASMLGMFDPQTGAAAPLWTSTWSQYDDHDNPGLLSLQDGRLLAIYARHNSANTFSYRRSLSTQPLYPGLWGAEQTLPSTGAGVTYANPCQLADEAGKVYNFCRDLNFNPTVLTSADAGNSWSAPQLFIKTGAGSIRPYVKYASDYAARIDFLYTDGHPRDVNNSLYHAYYRDGAVYKSDGTFLKSFGDLPLLHDSGERGTVIYQYSAADTADFNDHIPSGRAWCWEITYQTNTAPACVFTVQRDQVAGPAWSDDRIYYYYARWTGTGWQKRFIAQAGRPLYDTEDDYAGGIALDPEDPSAVYISSDAANPFDLTTITNVPLGPRYELYKGVTTNGGLSFSWSALTTNSAVDNFRPYVPRHREARPALIWFRGSYPTFTSFRTSVVGLFTNTFPRVDLIGYWPLDVTNGGTTPDLALGNPLTINGGASAVPGVFSNAFSFDGVAKYLSATPAPAASNALPVYQPGRAFTVAAWVRGAPQTGKYVFAEGNATNNNPLFLLQTGQTASANDRLDIFLRNTAGATLINHVASTRAVFDGAWHHLAYVDDAGAVQLYVDGLADIHFTYVPSGAFALATSSVGALVRASVGGLFAGAIDDVAAWSRALAPDEVLSVMRNSIPMPAPEPPSIFAQPADRTNGVLAGDDVSFSVFAAGSEPLGYQWFRDGAAISAAANGSAASNVLSLPAVQPPDAGAYSVVVSNALGSATSSLARLAVDAYFPVTNGTALRVDFDLSGSSNVSPGFQSFTLANNGSAFEHDVAVTVSPIGNVAVAERLRSGAPWVVDNPPALTQARLYNDFDFASGTADGTGLSIVISRLSPGTLYGLTIWSYDPQSPGLRVSDWTETASGTPVPIALGYSFNGSTAPAADYDYTFGALLRSSSAGKLRIEGVRRGGTSYGVFVNAVQLVANPELRVAAVSRTPGGQLRLVIDLQYPGQAVGFEESATLAPGSWQPASGPATVQTAGPRATADFSPSANRMFYRVVPLSSP
jgi:hypothetical protein